MLTATAVLGTFLALMNSRMAGLKAARAPEESVGGPWCDGDRGDRRADVSQYGGEAAIQLLNKVRALVRTGPVADGAGRVGRGGRAGGPRREVASERGLARTLLRGLALSMAVAHGAGRPDRVVARLVDFLRLTREVDYLRPLVRHRAISVAVLRRTLETVDAGDVRQAESMLLQVDAPATPTACSRAGGRWRRSRAHGSSCLRRRGVGRGKRTGGPDDAGAGRPGRPRRTRPASRTVVTFEAQTSQRRRTAQRRRASC